jgi:hypothetical protein
VLRIFCAIVACLAIAAAPAAAEIPEISGPSWPMITGPESPEEYAEHVELGKWQELIQASPTEAQVWYVGLPTDFMAFPIQSDGAHDADGAEVPVTLAVTGPETILWTVHHREGNPAAGFAPFAYPIIGGKGWEGGWHSFGFEMNEPRQPATEPPPAPVPPTPTCTVPSLRGLALHAAKARLRAADCGIGKVRLARGATEGKGKVARQYEPAGAQLAAGAAVAVRLAAR